MSTLRELRTSSTNVHEGVIFRNIPLKTVRKYVEKKLGVPKHSLNAHKAEFKKMVEVCFIQNALLVLGGGQGRCREAQLQCGREG